MSSSTLLIHVAHEESGNVYAPNWWCVIIVLTRCLMKSPINNHRTIFFGVVQKIFPYYDEVATSGSQVFLASTIDDVEPFPINIKGSNVRAHICNDH